MYCVQAVAVLVLVQQTFICLSSPIPQGNATSADAVNPNNASKLAADAASNVTHEAQAKYNSVPGLLNQVNEFGTASIGSVGNAAIDTANNLANVVSNAAGQLVNTVGMAGELLGLLSGGLFTTAGQIVNHIGTGVGGALNNSGKTLGTSFKEYGGLFTKLGSQTLSVGGKTAASALGASGTHLSTRDYTWEG